MAGSKEKPRPSTFTQEVFNDICKCLMEGQPLTKVLRENKRFPAKSTFFSWMSRADRDVLDQYAHAREVQGHVLAEEIVDLSDLAQGNDKIDTNKLRVQIDARKWRAAKMVPNVYGEATLMRNKVARKEEDEHIRHMKNITPDEPHRDIPTDPKQIARIFNWVITKKKRELLESKEKDDDD